MRVLLFCLACLPAAPASADFAPVTNKAEFLSFLGNKTLRDPLLRITLTIGQDGTISGTAVRWGVTGTWSWQDGFFCREMDWTGMAIPYNCQLVEVDGDRMRFTVDQGAGASATFSLR